MPSWEASRRTFLQRAGALGAATALAELPLLWDRDLLETAAAQSLDMTEDTISGLVAFALPGNDAYSVAQGESAPGPGGIAAGAVQAMIRYVDQYVGVANGSTESAVPASSAVAAGLNQYALRVNPAAARGGFPSPFARLSFREKAKALQQFEGEPAAANSELRFIGAILPGLAAYLSMSEAGYWDRATRRLNGRPLGWEIARYRGPVEGNAEFKGYWKGNKVARQSPGYGRRRRRQREAQRRRRRRGRRRGRR
jgi:hypothetical protein